MGMNTMETGRIIKNMAKELTNMPMETLTMANLSITKNEVKEYSSSQMEINMKVCLLMINSMEKEK